MLGARPLPLHRLHPGRRRTWTRRHLIDGIRWRTRTRAPWRDLPERYGPWPRRKGARGSGLPAATAPSGSPRTQPAGDLV
ncbi:transposase [Streptomyces sp. NPDC052071]|uniref:transposase n=1 Tax=unclassified Streptomyces TaxID=2593676 RepID=UPI00296FD311